MARGRRPSARASLFISPSGQPFHAGPGEPYPVSRWFAQVDANHDGRIDRAEFRADAAAYFKVLDKNHDGIIDGFELQAYEQDVVPESLGAYGAGPRAAAPVPGPPPPRPGGGRDARSARDEDDGGDVVMGGAAAYNFFSDPELVASTDRTLSSHITLADFLAAADRRFDRLDAKGLGFLTLAGLPKTAAQQSRKGRRRPDPES